jgi:hypothetical protein
VFTCNFARLKSLPPELEPVSIARFPARWYGSRRRYIALAPKANMLKMTQAEYDPLFEAILSGLDPAKVYADLGENAVMLCWESPHTVCHRRRVAEWLEQALGLVIPEFGFARDECPAYAAMVARETGVIHVPTAGTGKATMREPQKQMF